MDYLVLFVEMNNVELPAKTKKGSAPLEAMKNAERHMTLQPACAVLVRAKTFIEAGREKAN